MNWRAAWICRLRSRRLSYGVSLLGIDSVMRPTADRRMAWQGLESDLDRGKLAAMTSEIGLAEVIEAAPNIVEGRACGRIVVKIELPR